MRRLLCILLLGASVAGLAACGGSTSPSPLTASQYVAKLNGLCLAQAKAVDKLHVTLSITDWQSKGAKIVQAAERFTSAVSALKPPPTLATLVQNYLARNQKVLAASRATVTAARAGDPSRFHDALVKGTRAFKNASTFAQVFGATDC